MNTDDPSAGQVRRWDLLWSCFPPITRLPLRNWCKSSSSIRSGISATDRSSSFLHLRARATQRRLDGRRAGIDDNRSPTGHDEMHREQLCSSSTTIQVKHGKLSPQVSRVHMSCLLPHFVQASVFYLRDIYQTIRMMTDNYVNHEQSMKHACWEGL